MRWLSLSLSLGWGAKLGWLWYLCSSSSSCSQEAFLSLRVVVLVAGLGRTGVVAVVPVQQQRLQLRTTFERFVVVVVAGLGRRTGVVAVVPVHQQRLQLRKEFRRFVAVLVAGLGCKVVVAVVPVQQQRLQLRKEFRRFAAVLVAGLGRNVGVAVVPTQAAKVSCTVTHREHALETALTQDLTTARTACSRSCRGWGSHQPTGFRPASCMASLAATADSASSSTPVLESLPHALLQG